MSNTAARTLFLSGALARRIDQLEHRLPPVPADGWHSIGDPAPEIRSLLAAARGHATARRYRAAAELLAEAGRLFQGAERALREARLQAAAELMRTRDERRRAAQLERLAKGRLRGAQANRRRARKRIVALIPEARRLRSDRGWSLGSIASHFQRDGKTDLSTRQIVRHLRAAGLK